MTTLTHQSDATAAESLVNIGFTERRIRLSLGLLLLAFGAILTVFLAPAAPSWLAWPVVLLLLALYYQGIRFVLDHQTGTCPIKAELGQRRLDARFSILGEPIPDQSVARRIRRVSRGALARAAAGSALLTGASLAARLVL